MGILVVLMHAVSIPESLTYARIVALLIANLLRYGSTSFYIVTIIQELVGRDFLGFSFTLSTVSVWIKQLEDQSQRIDLDIKPGYHMQNLQELNAILCKLSSLKQTENGESEARLSLLTHNTIAATPATTFSSSSLVNIASDGCIEDKLSTKADDAPKSTPVAKLDDKSNEKQIKVDPSILLRIGNFDTELKKSRKEERANLLETGNVKPEDLDYIFDRGRSYLFYCFKRFVNPTVAIRGVRFVSASFAAISGPLAFSGSLKDWGLGSAIGIIAAIFLSFSDTSRFFEPLQIFLSSLACGSLTFILCYYDDRVSFWPTVLGATLWNLPGFLLVIGAMEIIALGPSGSLIGISMFIRGCSDGIAMALGFSIAIYSCQQIFREHSVPLRFEATEKQPLWLIATIGTFFLSIGSTLLMEGTLWQTFWSAVSTIACYLVYFGCVYLELPDPISEFLASIAVGVSSLIISCFTKDCYLVYAYTAILPVVPGGYFVKGMFGIIGNLVLDHSTLHGDSTKIDGTKYPPLGSAIVSAFIVGYGLVISDSIFNLFKKSIKRYRKLISERNLNNHPRLASSV